jgi:predicted nuclease of predicted toxin-antitoxin system
MLSLLADENFSHRILRGIKLRIKNLDVVVGQSVGLCGASDPSLLAWAADQRRIVLTHDRQTLPKYAYDRIRSHQAMPGIIVVSDTMPVGEAIEVVTMYLECGTAEDFENLVMFLP